MDVQRLHCIAQVTAADWNRLAGNDDPFIRHEFLLALEESGAITAETGWQPAHLLVTDGGRPLAGMPLYLKSHSRGEYVFDQQWAAAYRQTGGEYYPKLLTAVPLTPCRGPRLLAAPEADRQSAVRLLLATVRELAETGNLSSWHCLFPDEETLEYLRGDGLSIREDVQFQWFNRGYRNFEDFLQTMSAAKRKMLKRERRRAAEQGIALQRLTGTAITDEHWQVLFEFYQATYFKRGGEPYLNMAFFQQIGRSMADRCLLVLAAKDGRPVAAALSFIGSDCLYGRHWGCREEYNGLHFEVCYYQGVDFCIERGFHRFDSGAQGEHKISRGFEPVTTHSAHWFGNRHFATAVDRFLAEERRLVSSYKRDAEAYLPFKGKI